MAMGVLLTPHVQNRPCPSSGLWLFRLYKPTGLMYAMYPSQAREEG